MPEFIAETTVFFGGVEYSPHQIDHHLTIISNKPQLAPYDRLLSDDQTIFTALISLMQHLTYSKQETECFNELVRLPLHELPDDTQPLGETFDHRAEIAAQLPFST
ncbi:hypothetical protein BMS3Bbin04_00615 [bacterium BMS3Bbin04]|nr:hypothetical protein BMS3Bbin04_00615 [bacterium BMS3Bbin04]